MQRGAGSVLHVTGAASSGCIHKEESSEGSADVSSLAGQLTAAHRCSPAWYARGFAAHVPSTSSAAQSTAASPGEEHRATVKPSPALDSLQKQSRILGFARPIIRGGGGN